MCGILGFQGDFSQEVFVEGLNKIAHRGPDDAGVFIDADNRISLGHRRLSILDLSASGPSGHQPMASPDGKVVLVFNGEIYNFRELRAELEAKGTRFCGNADTEVLLNLYLEEGQDMLHRLNGIFAFALWDDHAKTLFLARDGLGVKPLYYAVTNHGVAFAREEIKGLLPLIPEACELDFVALHRYLSFLWCPGEGTPLKVVRKLPPGEALEIRDGKIARQWTWYQLPVFRGIKASLDEDALTCVFQ